MTFDSSEETLSLAAELIACPTVAPADAGAQEIVARKLEDLGFQVVRLEVEGVKSLWAEYGTGPLFVFLGHTDVVPTGEEDRWTSPPFEPAVRDGFLYGRGAADMKGGVAAMVTAVGSFLAAKKEEFCFSIGVLLAGDEEADYPHGTTDILQLLKEKNKSVDYCIVGEPSSQRRLGDTVKVGRRGSLTGVLKVQGLEGHAAYAERACNAIALSIPSLLELSEIQWASCNDQSLMETFQLTNIQSGTGAANVIPGLLEAVFNLRFSEGIDPEEVKKRSEEVFKRHELDYQIEWILGAKPFVTKKGVLIDVVTETIEKELGIKPELSMSGGTSDGRYVAEIGAEVVEVGLSNESIHQVDECVNIADLTALSRLYQAILEKFAKRCV